MKIVLPIVTGAVAWLAFAVGPAQQKTPARELPLRLGARALNGCTISTSVMVAGVLGAEWVVVQADISHSKAHKINPGTGDEFQDLFSGLRAGTYKVEGILFGTKGEIARQVQTINLTGCKED